MMTITLSRLWLLFRKWTMFFMSFQIGFYSMIILFYIFIFFDIIGSVLKVKALGLCFGLLLFILLSLGPQLRFGLQGTGKYLFNQEYNHETGVVSITLTINAERTNAVRTRHSEGTVSQSESEKTTPNEAHEVPRPTYLDSRATTYTYSPLLSTDIRLLQILPSETDTSPLRFKLVHIPLLTARIEGYTALSYMWGTEPATSTVFLDEKAMNIRPSLDHTLRRLRSIHCAFIWVDAICINQADLKECSAQILRMRGIYAGARRVLAAINTTIHAESLLRLLTLVDSVLDLEEPNETVNDLIKDPAVLSALDEFCNHGYWNRIWIIQEFAIGDPLFLLIGDITVEAEMMGSFLALLANHPRRPQRLDSVNAIFDIRNLWKKRGSMPLLHMLYETRTSLCSRRHDRVFGLIGLAPDALDYLSEPNYEVDLKKLSLSMTQSYINRHSLDIILLAPHHKRRSALPSWCPDYFGYDKHLPDPRILGLSRNHRPHDTYGDIMRTRELRGWSLTGYAPSDVVIMGDILQSLAHHLGSICSLGRAWSDPDGRGFPRHDKNWASRCKKVDITKLLYDAILEKDYGYNHPFNPQHSWFGLSSSVVYAYCYTHAFLESHGDCDTENLGNYFQRWLCANRDFFVGGRYLSDHAQQLRHPIFHCGLAAWHDDVFRDRLIPYRHRRVSDGLLGYSISSNRSYLFEPLVKMASQNMRLMCLDNASFGIGWAARGARIHDDVFLLPGCSSPLILRRRKADGRYQVIGDAIVIGAMEGEVWENTTPDDFVTIEIY